jgi:hypothetical protein
VADGGPDSPSALRVPPPIGVRQPLLRPYVFDRGFGRCFFKLCTDAPYSVWVWCNGNEWVRSQAHKAGISYAAMDNGSPRAPIPGAAVDVLHQALRPRHHRISGASRPRAPTRNRLSHHPRSPWRAFDRAMDDYVADSVGAA